MLPAEAAHPRRVRRPPLPFSRTSSEGHLPQNTKAEVRRLQVHCPAGDQLAARPDVERLFALDGRTVQLGLRHRAQDEPRVWHNDGDERAFADF